MRSWIFRHRLRLRAVYGPRPPAPPSAGPSRPQRARALNQGLAPGECARVGRWFWLRPNVPELA